MAKLITNHDPLHIHKILGLLVLCHYIYRFALLFLHGTAFPTNDKYAVLGVLLHGVLSWSSLLLPLPKRRNFTSPMIWPEFRLHSITFATRHVVSTILTLLGAWPEDNDYLYSTLARGAVILGTVKIASLITDYYGDRERRTTNSMPYPDAVKPEQQIGVKQHYALAQFGATAACLIPDASLNFAALLGIQMAPLMMTLVRKGKVTAKTYHCIYSLSLYLGYVMVFTRLLTSNPLTFLSTSLSLKAVVLIMFPSSKIRRFASSPMVAACSVVLSTLIYPLILQDFVNSMISADVANSLFWILLVMATLKQAKVYSPLFLADSGVVTKEKKVDNGKITQEEDTSASNRA